MKLSRLGVNLDHIATLRQVRGTIYPNFASAIQIVEEAGADGITIHLREDRRHIQDADVFVAREKVRTHLNLEMAAIDEMVGIACQVKPNFCCLVPERREELTTEGGLDVLGQVSRLRDVNARLAADGILVSLFIEASKAVIDATVEVGAPIIELHTGHYADAKSTQEAAQKLQQLTEVAEYAASVGLIVNAGHGLHRDNVHAIANISPVNELNIGHSIIADAIFMGLGGAVWAMKAAIQGPADEH